MAQRDFFADIAFMHHPVGKDELSEIAPIKLDKRFFKPSAQAADPIIDKGYVAEVQAFKERLNDLRSQYAPFMENHVPPVPQERKYIELKEFQFRFETEQDKTFTNVLNGEGDWETVRIPDYRGPAGEQGKWTAFYRTEFTFSPQNGKRVFVLFKGVDYIANVYVNHKYVGSHEGLFAPFEFDVTDYLQEKNILVVEVKNDYTILGVEGTPLDGDKIYAATGPGWDDPQSGWHHCPPGAGIYNRVFVEERAEFFVQDIFVRPDIDKNRVEVRLELTNTHNGMQKDFEVDLEIYPRNFKDGRCYQLHCNVPYAGPGKNYFRYVMDLEEYHLWEPDSPCLYTLRASLSRSGDILDVRDRNFGMRKFHMEEEKEPKGDLYLNNKPILLRGANEMGHLQQCVMNEQWDQLIDDILIGKLANMNYYRVTQRPVQEEIYDYFDMLGMMHQCDLPLFGFLRRSQFAEAVRQTGEMERLVRSHPSTIMVSFINEPVAIRMIEGGEEKFVRRYYEKAHRNFFRDEMEAFFVAARKAIYIENPDRVIKNVEGDYDPPTADGLSDFHCYNMWYTNHALPLGKLYKGYIPPIRKGWKTGCGEYGAEGLDNYDIMMNSYPKEWIPENEDTPWIPDKIVRAQTYKLHGDWYEEQNTIKAWIEESQKHQALATSMLTDAYRRRSDRIVQTAVHLLIDAWPSGWMKTLLGVDRIPKPAFFAFQKSLEPVRVNIRCDRWKVYGGDTVEAEAWILNDTPKEYPECRIVATLRDEQQDYHSYTIAHSAKGAISEYAGTVPVRIPSVSGRQKMHLDVGLYDNNGNKINEERFTFEVFEKTGARNGKKITFLGEKAHQLLTQLNVEADELNGQDKYVDVVIATIEECLNQNRETVLNMLKQGTRLILIRDNEGKLEGELAGHSFKLTPINGVFFAATNKEDDRTKNFLPGDFAYWYNHETDMLDFTADAVIDCKSDVKPLVYTYSKSTTIGLEKGKQPIVGSTKVGSGDLVFFGLPTESKIGLNPALDRLLYTLLYYNS